MNFEIWGLRYEAKSSLNYYGQIARLASRVGEISWPTAATADIMRGVVSIRHEYRTNNRVTVDR